MSVHAIRDGAGETIGFIAIDSTVAGRAIGGLRMMPDVSEEELRLLAHAMTLKYGFLGLPHGGAKAGVLADPMAPRDVRDRALQRFGAGASEFIRTRRYAPGSDMGTNSADVRTVLAAAGARTSRRDLRVTHSARFTGLGVWLALEASALHAGIKLDGATALIEGYGNVGKELSGHMQSAGIRVIGTSTAAAATYEGKPLPVPELLEQPADILAPCARHHSINASNAVRIRARVVVPGANCPVTPEAEEILRQRGILVFPDFVANGGGVLGGTMEFAGIPLDAIDAFFRTRFAARMRALLREGPPGTLRERAESFALARFKHEKDRAERGGMGRSLFAAGLSAFRGGLLPSGLLRPFSMRYFEARVAE